MKKKKVDVLHAQIPFNRGGAELMVDNLVVQLKKRGFDTELITLPYKWYPESSLYDSMLMWRMLDITEREADLLIATKFPSYGVKHSNKVAWITHQFRQVYDLYESPYGYKSVQGGERIRQHVMKYDGITLSECKDIYGISKTVAKRILKNNGLECKTLYHPPSMVGKYYHEEYGNYIVSVGRLDKLKRNELLIQAMKYCDSAIKVKIAGKGSEMENLKKVAIECGVDNRVEFLGFVPDRDLLKLYAKAFAVFFAPVDEDYGYITLEAFLSYKPLITSYDSGGVLEFAKNGVNSYICDKDPEDIGRKIEQLFLNKKKCSEFGDAGYELVKDITWDNVIDVLTESCR